MRVFIALTAIFLSCAGVGAGDGDPTSYLVYISSFTSLSLNAIKGHGLSKNDQPSKMKYYITPPNTNYAEVILTTTTKAESDTVTLLLSQGKVRRLRRIRYVSDSRGESGIEVVDCKGDPVNFVCYPTDWSRDWTEVAVSSP